MNSLEEFTLSRWAVTRAEFVGVGYVNTLERVVPFDFCIRGVKRFGKPMVIEDDDFTYVGCYGECEDGYFLLVHGYKDDSTIAWVTSCVILEGSKADAVEHYFEDYTWYEESNGVLVIHNRYVVG